MGMEAKARIRPTLTVAELAAALPRSRALPMLRTPAPYRGLVVFLALVSMSAGALSLAPALIARAELAAALFDVANSRIEPSVLHAETGRWPRADEMPWLESSVAGGKIEARYLTEHGVGVTLARRDDRVELELVSTRAPGGTLRWACRVRAVDADAGLDPLSVPFACRP